MPSDYTEFVANAGTENEETLMQALNAAVVVPEGVPVIIGGKRYLSEGSVLYVDNQRIAVEVRVRDDEIVVLPVGNSGPTSFKGSYDDLVKHAHVHNSEGFCLKNRYGKRCKRD